MKLQDAFLKELIDENMPATLYLMNGFQLRGIVKGYDEEVLVLVADGKQQMLYKHSITTIAPIRPLKALSDS